MNKFNFYDYFHNINVQNNVSKAFILFYNSAYLFNLVYS